MVINHNISSMNANRQYGVVTGYLAKSAEKLSSGYKINRAADDAAGLTISEKMRSQIRGLGQASENAQQGVSLIQIAEGAMAESQEILHRMTELSVKSANGTNTKEDRSAIQKEIGELSLELDRISESTEFNTMKLLDGSVSKSISPAAEKKLLEYIKGSWLNDGLARIDAATGWQLNEDIQMEVTLSSLGNSVMASMGSWPGGNRFVLDINRDMIPTFMDYAESGPLIEQLYSDRMIAHELTHAMMYHNDTSRLSDIPKWFTEGVAEAVHGSDDYRFGDVNAASVLSAYDELKEFDFDISAPNIECYSVGMLAVGYLYNYDGDGVDDHTEWNALMEGFSASPRGTSFSDLFRAAYGKSLSNVLKEFEDGADAARLDADPVTALQTYFGDTCGFVIGDPYADPLDNPHQEPEGAVANNPNITPISNPEETITDPISGKNITFIWPEIGVNRAMPIHVGTSADQYIEFTIGAMSSKSLFGNDGVDASTQHGARESLKVIEKALDYVSSERSKLGAVQNRLEHTIKNLDQTTENTQAAESRLRDVDMAAEMVTYSKNRILAQAGESMLVQANQQPNGVLSLLQ